MTLIMLETSIQSSPLCQSHSEIGKCFSNPGLRSVAAGQQFVKLGTWASELGPKIYWLDPDGIRYVDKTRA